MVYLFSLLIIASYPNDLIGYDPSFEYSAFRQPSNDSVLEDIYSHYDPKSPAPINTYIDSISQVTNGHECLHGVCANLRRGKLGFNGFYLLKNRAILVKEPPITIQEVARHIPAYLRFPIFQTYLVNAAVHRKDQYGNELSWDYAPLYILDEGNAYLAGSSVRKDYQLKQNEYTYKQAIEMWIYSIYLLKECPSSYEDYDKLLWLVKFQYSRILEYNFEADDNKTRTDLLALAKRDGYLLNFLDKVWADNPLKDGPSILKQTLDTPAAGH